MQAGVPSPTEGKGDREERAVDEVVVCFAVSKQKNELADRSNGGSMNRNDPKLTPLAQQLRKNMTEEEGLVWHCCLKKMPFKFHRQKVIGKYIVDFYCAEKKTVIEIDGEQHYTEQGRKDDAERTAYLNSRRLTVLRYSNHEVKTNLSGVFNDIYSRLKGDKVVPQDSKFDGKGSELL